MPYAHRFLDTLAEVAAPDAVIIGQRMDPYQTADPLHLGYHRRNRALGRMAEQVRMRVRHKDLAADWFDYLFASVEELEGLVSSSAWRVERCEVDDALYVALLGRPR